MRRTGIELSSLRCTVVEADTSSRQRKRAERTLVRVHNFAVLGRPDNPQALTAGLKLLLDARVFPRRAWVTLWDIRSTHHYMLLPADRRKEIGAVARQHGTSVLGLTAREISIGTMEGAQPTAPFDRRGAKGKIELSFFAAASEDIQSLLRPVQEAGFTVEGVSTPCGALWALARLRRSPVPGHVHAYVSLGEAMSALVIVSNGSLLYARQLDWGYAESFADPPTPRSREDLASRLAGELRRSFLYLKQYWDEDVSQLLLCGDMPEIRSLTAPLIERLSIEVETLDSLDGIDTEQLPEPADQFVDQVASMRMASATAAEPPPVNLLPVEIAAAPVTRAWQMVFALGAAAAVAFGAFLHQVAVTRTQGIEQQVAALQRQIAAIQPRVQAAESSRAGLVADSAQQSSLDAFDTQGPRVAHFLETLSDATPRSVHITSDGSQWRVSVRTANPSGVETTAEYSVPK